MHGWHGGWLVVVAADCVRGLIEFDKRGEELQARVGKLAYQGLAQSSQTIPAHADRLSRLNGAKHKPPASCRGFGCTNSIRRCVWLRSALGEERVEEDDNVVCGQIVIGGQGLASTGNI